MAAGSLRNPSGAGAHSASCWQSHVRSLALWKVQRLRLLLDLSREHVHTLAELLSVSSHSGIRRPFPLLPPPAWPADPAFTQGEELAALRTHLDQARLPWKAEPLPEGPFPAPQMMALGENLPGRGRQ